MVSSLESEKSLTATVLITTKDRKEDLRTALRSCMKQTADPEVIVVDDGSTDGTAKMVKEEFPSVRLLRKEKSGGYITARNLGTEMASGDIVFSIDDDAAFSTPHVVEQTLSDFTRSEIGAVAIPYVDVQASTETNQQPPDTNSVYCAFSFRGTAYAVRRQTFLDLGGYREHFVHQGEEMDLCIRMLDAGSVVRLGTADVINHYESPRRSYERMDFFGRRNDVLFVWHNAPAPYHLVWLLVMIVNTGRCVAKYGRAANFLKGLLKGYADCIRFWDKRDPVRVETFKLFHQLRREGPTPISTLLEHPLFCS